MVDQNPYAPPSANDAEAKVVVDGDGWGESLPFVKASRWMRLFGWLIDVLFAWGLTAASEWGTERVLGASLTVLDLQANTKIRALVGVGGSVLVLGVQGVLIAYRGQSLGKIALGMRIVLADGTVAGVSRGFLRRTLPFEGMVLVPSLMMALWWTSVDASLYVAFLPIVMSLRGLAGVLMLLDALWIFRRGARCLHDVLGGTFVERRRPAVSVADG